MSQVWLIVALALILLAANFIHTVFRGRWGACPKCRGRLRRAGTVAYTGRGADWGAAVALTCFLGPAGFLLGLSSGVSRRYSLRLYRCPDCRRHYEFEAGRGELAEVSHYRARLLLRGRECAELLGLERGELSADDGRKIFEMVAREESRVYPARHFTAVAEKTGLDPAVLGESLGYGGAPEDPVLTQSAFTRLVNVALLYDALRALPGAAAQEARVLLTSSCAAADGRPLLAAAASRQETESALDHLAARGALSACASRAAA